MESFVQISKVPPVNVSVKFAYELFKAGIIAVYFQLMSGHEPMLYVKFVKLNLIFGSPIV